MEMRGQLYTIVALGRYISSILHFKERYLGLIASLDNGSKGSFLCPCWKKIQLPSERRCLVTLFFIHNTSFPSLLGHKIYTQLQHLYVRV